MALRIPDRLAMRFFDELITFRDRGSAARASMPVDDVCSDRPQTPDITRSPAATARHTCARRADMTPAAFCRLVAIWIGAVAIVLVTVLAIRWLG